MTTEVERVHSFVRDMKKRLKAHAKRWDKAYENFLFIKVSRVFDEHYTYDDSDLDDAFKTLLKVAKVMDRTERLSRRTDKGATKR